MMTSNHLILCHPLFLLIPIFPSIRVLWKDPDVTVCIGGQNTGASALASVLPMNIRGWFSLRLTGLISLLSKGLSRVFSNITVQKHQFFSTQVSVQLSHLYMTTGKTIALTRRTFDDKVTSLLFNMLSRLVTAFLPRSKHRPTPGVHSNSHPSSR